MSIGVAAGRVKKEGRERGRKKEKMVVAVGCPWPSLSAADVYCAVVERAREAGARGGLKE